MEFKNLMIRTSMLRCNTHFERKIAKAALILGSSAMALNI